MTSFLYGEDSLDNATNEGGVGIEHYGRDGCDEVYVSESPRRVERRGNERRKHEYAYGAKKSKQ